MKNEYQDKRYECILLIINGLNVLKKYIRCILLNVFKY